MKRNSLLKAIIISFLVVAFLSWVIPAGSYYYEEFTKGTTNPLGIPDLLSYPLQIFSLFGRYGLPFLVIGGLYGILNKTGVYSKLVNKFAATWKGKENFALVVSIVVFAVISALTGLSMLLFVFVPFFASVLMLLGYKRITAMLATVGAILVGGMTPIFTSDNAYLFSYINSFATNYGYDNINNLIIVKIILFVILTGALIGFTWLKGEREVIAPVKEETKKKKKEAVKETVTETKHDTILFTEYEVENRSYVPLVVTMIIFFVVALVGMFNWYNVFKIDIFNTAYTAITGFKVLGYPLFANIIGSLTAFGSWGTVELSMLMIVFGLIIGWLYNLKFKEMMTSFIDGAKELLPTAIYVTLATVVMYYFMTTSSIQQDPTITSASPLYSIINKIIGSSKDLNVFGLFKMIGIAGFGGIYLNEFSYFWQNTIGPIMSVYSLGNLYSVVVLIFETVFGLLMFILPTSLTLIAGLSYFEIPYKQWVKKSWMYLLVAFGVILLATLVTFLFLK